jgi:hypothetical protein
MQCNQQLSRCMAMRMQNHLFLVETLQSTVPATWSASEGRSSHKK